MKSHLDQGIVKGVEWRAHHRCRHRHYLGGGDDNCSVEFPQVGREEHRFLGGSGMVVVVVGEGTHIPDMDKEEVNRERVVEEGTNTPAGRNVAAAELLAAVVVIDMDMVGDIEDRELNLEVGIEENLKVVDMELNWDGNHMGKDYIETNDYNYSPFNKTDVYIYICIYTHRDTVLQL